MNRCFLHKRHERNRYILVTSRTFEDVIVLRVSASTGVRLLFLDGGIYRHSRGPDRKLAFW